MDQIRTVDRQIITKVFGDLVEKEVSKVKEVLKETYVDYSQRLVVTEGLVQLRFGNMAA